MKDFRKLKVWHKAAALGDLTYKIANSLPPAEVYRLSDQMNKASVSIELNISEGCCRKGDAEFGRFLQMAMGSASELENCFDICGRRGFAVPADLRRGLSLVVEVKKMLSSLINKLKADGC